MAPIPVTPPPVIKCGSRKPFQAALYINKPKAIKIYSLIIIQVPLVIDFKFIFNPIYKTIFTILPNTTMIFFGVFPSRSLTVCSFDMAVFSTSSLLISAGKSIMKRTLPLNDIGYFTIDSFRYSSLQTGKTASHTDSVLPSVRYNSSATWGAKGASKITRGSSMDFLLHFNVYSSFTQIINADTDVLYEKFSISNVIFLMVLCSVFSSSTEGCSSLTNNKSSL